MEHDWNKKKNHIPQLKARILYQFVMHYHRLQCLGTAGHTSKLQKSFTAFLKKKHQETTDND